LIPAQIALEILRKYGWLDSLQYRGGPDAAIDWGLWPQLTPEILTVLQRADSVIRIQNKRTFPEAIQVSETNLRVALEDLRVRAETLTGGSVEKTSKILVHSERILRIFSLENVVGDIAYQPGPWMVASPSIWNVIYWAEKLIEFLPRPGADVPKVLEYLEEALVELETKLTTPKWS
jgi:hypothetical protein